ncbi:aspartyl-phosphate phosphatase Spo0E family protein [Mesobacillus zeae]|uniref:Aspartyl-phosphate phosphatase Spo0E family protein n=1 Tax=Mesobacillus zeae TaxID=1917180 RepID=A0A398BEP7_9BACI|nr:aspartyl-phosphate phosphatase Spo0E family protein [Mesobacillus zeae]RID88267.1 aspartyl-phosphate phosphatase Spo0E family protein [Mesobacillus zeae]
MESATVLILKELHQYIEYLRSNMISLGTQFGFNHEMTIKASQELDYLIYKYQVITRKMET